MFYRKLYAISLVCILGLSAKATAEYSPDRNIPWDPSVYMETMPNGMQLFLRENHKPEQRLEIRLVVRSGAMHDKDGAEGIAHFLEHMAFNGTEHFEAGQIFKYLESIGSELGADNNAYTSWDQTVYILKIPSDDDEVLKKSMQIIADYMHGMVFAPEEIEQERGVILEEYRLSQGLEKRIGEKAVKIAAEGSRWDTPRLGVLGSRESLEKVQRDDFLDYYSKWYRPDRMALIVIGDVSVDKMRQLVSEYIEPIKNPDSDPEFPEYGMPDHEKIFSGIITDRELPAGGGSVVLVRPHKSEITEKDYRDSIIDRIIYHTLNRRLEELKESGDPPFMEGYMSKYMDGPWFDLMVGFTVTLQMKKEEKAYRALVREIERIRRHGLLADEISDEMLDITEGLKREVSEKEKMMSGRLTYKYLSAFTDRYTAASEEEYLRMAQDISGTLSKEDIDRRAAELFEPVNMSLIIALPEWQKKMYSKKHIHEWYEETIAEDIQPYTRKELIKEKDYSAITPAKVIEREELESVGAVRVKFENGLTLYLKATDFKEDEIRISSYNRNRPTWSEGWGNYGITSMMSRLWMNGGTKEFTSTEIERLQKGKEFWVSPGVDFQAGSINRDVDEAFQWMYDFITEPGFRSEALEIIKSEKKAELREEKLTQDYAFSRAVGEIMCPGRRSSVFIDDGEYYDRFTAEELEKWWRDNFHAGTMQFTIVGNIDIDKTIDTASRYLGTLPPSTPQDIPYIESTCPFPSGYTRREIYRGMEDKTRVSIAIPGPGWHSPDFPVARVMTKILDIRLNDHIREALGGTYYSYVYASSNPYVKGADYIRIGFATKPERVEELISEMDGIIAKFVEEGPTEKEIHSAREIFEKDHEEELKENNFWMGVLNGAEYRPTPIEFQLELYDKTMEVQAADISRAAEKWLDPDTDRVEIIAYKEKKPVALETGGEEE